jgi:adenylyltransferase/sulfurtransferase
VQIDRYEVALSSENARTFFGLRLRGRRHRQFPHALLVNDACVLLKKPNVYGSIFRFEGQATVFGYPGGPCYRCLYPEPPPPVWFRAAPKVACWESCRV